MLDLVRSLSEAHEPRQVLRSFAEGMARLRGVSGYASLSTRNLPPGCYRITRLLLGDAWQGMAEANPWANLQDLPVFDGGVLGGIVRGGVPAIIRDLNLPDDPAIGNALHGYRSLLAIPLYDEGRPLNWAIMLRNQSDAFGDAEIEETILRSNLVGTAVRSVRTAAELRKANDRITSEVERIASIQRALLPRGLPSIHGVRLATSYQVHDQAGGDYYDFIPLTDGRWTIVIADASGHGPAAAVLMAMLQTLLHAYAVEGHGPADIAGHVNRHLARKGIEGSFITAVIGQLDPADRSFRFIRAGHPPALVKDPGPEAPVWRLDQVGEIPFGIFEDVAYTEHSVTLRPEQTIVLYTDGVVDARNEQGDPFGVAGLERALHLCTGDPDCVLSSIGVALREHEPPGMRDDDQTILAMRVE